MFHQIRTPQIHFPLWETASLTRRTCSCTDWLNDQPNQCYNRMSLNVLHQSQSCRNKRQILKHLWSICFIDKIMHENLTWCDDRMDKTSFLNNSTRELKYIVMRCMYVTCTGHMKCMAWSTTHMYVCMYVCMYVWRDLLHVYRWWCQLVCT
jgi:hypothetical protein